MGRNIQNVDVARYIDRYSYIAGKKMLEGEVTNKVASNDMINEFVEVILTSQSFKFYIASTESAKQFWKSCKSVAELFPSEYREDLFFTAKLGKHYDGVNSKLVYMLQKAKSQFKFPNLALSSIKFSDLAEFCIEGALADCSIYDVICNIWGVDVKILSPYRRRAKIGDCVEIYIQEDSNMKIIDRVAVISDSISSCINDNELSSIIYDVKKGLCIGDFLLRQMAGKCGVTRHDFDLREVL